MDVTALEFLLTASGRRLLDAASTTYGVGDPIAANRRLRSLGPGYTADQVAAALTQAGLRRSAVTKFGADAASLFFTPVGLEQATHPVVATYRARRAAAAGGAAGACSVDLGCGIGSDLAAFARAGFAVTGIDGDAVTARVAKANLEAIELTGTVSQGQAEDIDVTGYDVVFVDPSRRSGSTRTFDPRAFSPPWDFVLGLLDRRPGGPRAVVKLAPGLDHALVPASVEAEWVSLEGQLKEAVLWSPPPQREAGLRRATVLALDGAVHSCTDEASPPGPPPVREVGRFVYEPDPAVVRAHLVTNTVAETAGWLLDPHLAYVSSDLEVRTPFARGFEVVDVLPFQEKQLRAALRARGIGSLTIKKRGIDVTPEDLRRRLALRGSSAATLILTRTPGSAAALLVEPLERHR